MVKHFISDFLMKIGNEHNKELIYHYHIDHINHKEREKKMLFLLFVLRLSTFFNKESLYNNLIICEGMMYHQVFLGSRVVKQELQHRII